MIVRGVMIGVVIVAVTASTVRAQQTTPAVPVQSSAQIAFEHYEAIRVALAGDTIQQVSEHAKALAPHAAALAPETSVHVEAIQKATAVADARKHFGELSALLVPKFLDAKLPGVHGFMCPMVKKPWAQKSDKMENPYYGKSMPTCGSPIKRQRSSQQSRRGGEHHQRQGCAPALLLGDFRLVAGLAGNDLGDRLW